MSQFLNGKINQRTDRMARTVCCSPTRCWRRSKRALPDLTRILRISGNEMSPEFGILPEDLAPLLKLAAEYGIHAVHVGMGSACASPPWYFHHSRMPEQPQLDALAWVRKQTDLPLIAAGRMGRRIGSQRSSTKIWPTLWPWAVP
jgi:2,4-dienoyl-CoA reductase-like NADH-dependent reductase (Old Yellow Enzyme family)